MPTDPSHFVLPDASVSTNVVFYLTQLKVQLGLGQTQPLMAHPTNGEICITLVSILAWAWAQP